MSAESGAPENSGTEFKPITSQDDLNRIIADRVSRERGKFADYETLKENSAMLSGKLADLESLNSELSEKVAGFESAQARSALVAKVAEAVGVDPKAIRGDTEEELTEHAKYVKTLLDSRPSAPVIPSQGKSPENVQDNPLRELTRSLFENKE